jgi:hypothetical protein
MSMRAKMDVWNVTVRLDAGTPAFSNNIATIQLADQFGQVVSTTKLQLPFGFKIKDIVVASEPKVDCVVVIDKNNGWKQWQSVPLSQLVVQAGRPRLDPFGKDAWGRRIVPAFARFDILTIVVRPLADVGGVDGGTGATVTFQLYVEYT